MYKRITKYLFLLPLIFALAACETNTDSDNIISNVAQLEWTKDASIYEINIRQYSEEGTLEEVRKDLPRIKDMGIKILWLMPIHPIGVDNKKGTLGSPYSVQDYKEIHPDYGTKDDFKKFVEEAHGLGLKVIIDWVANHTAWDNPWIANKDWFELNEEGEFIPPHDTDWSDVIQLDYDNNEMRAAMIDALEYWVREFDIDGYRCDVAGMVPTDFWKDAKKALDDIKPVFMLAEDGEPELLIEAFQMNYAWEYAHIIREIAKGNRKITAVDSLFAEDAKKFPSSGYRMYFTTNHDENSWTGTDEGMFGDNFHNFAVLSATVPGMPLIYNGQESGLDKQLEFFEKDPIDWKEYKYQDFYKMLLELKKNEKALWNGHFGGNLEFIEATEELYAYKRVKDDSEVIVVLNFTDDYKTRKLSKIGITENHTAYNTEYSLIEGNDISFGANEWFIFVK